MIPQDIYSTMSPQEHKEYESKLRKRLSDLDAFKQAINGEMEAITLELQVLDWRKNSGKTITKKITLYEDFFKKVRKAPRQDKHIDLDVMAEARRALEEL